MVVAPEYSIIDKLTIPENSENVRNYIESAKRTSEIDRMSTERVKTGVPLRNSCD